MMSKSCCSHFRHLKTQDGVAGYGNRRPCSGQVWPLVWVGRLNGRDAKIVVARRVNSDVPRGREGHVDLPSAFFIDRRVIRIISPMLTRSGAIEFGSEACDIKYLCAGTRAWYGEAPPPYEDDCPNAKWSGSCFHQSRSRWTARPEDAAVSAWDIKGGPP